MPLPPRDNALDAFFPDEWGAPYLTAPKQGIHLNKFTRIFVNGASGSPPREITSAEATQQKIDPADKSVIAALVSESYRDDLLNPLDASLQQSINPPFPAPQLPAQGIPKQAKGQKRTFSTYVPSAWPASVGTGSQSLTVDVILWFGVGSELNRHGLRNFVSQLSGPNPTVFILVPGVEPGHPDAFGGRWAIGVTSDQIQALVNATFRGTLPAPLQSPPSVSLPQLTIKIKSLYAFSTGWLGFSASVRNQLFPLSDVERVVIVDCLYPDGGNIQVALNMLLAATRGSVKIVTYVASAGTPGYATNQLQVNVPRRGESLLVGGKIGPAYQTLTHARVLNSGLSDQIVQWSDIDPVVQPYLRTLFSSMPARGSVVSDVSVFSYVHGASPSGASVALLDWYNGLPQEVTSRVWQALWNDRPPFDALVRLIWGKQLPGWSGLPAGVSSIHASGLTPTMLNSGVHDFLPFEFAWECMF
jgi:hypothetical protein